MRWTEIATALVAIYGALLGTYNLYKRLNENKSRVRVKISIGVMMSPGLGTLSDVKLFAEAANVGLRPATLAKSRGHTR